MTAVAHRRAEFMITLAAPYETVAPLFGADKERVWAEGWDPHFLHPQPATDRSGAVFTIEHGHSRVWINTAYDLAGGHVQYACFAPDTMVTLIDISMRRLTPRSTEARVAYERTALRPDANDHVNRLADADARMGSAWQDAISAYLATIP